jgi:predicted MFS family arabinose efflux permease
MTGKATFSPYQILVILGLAFLLFTVVLDYMLLPALSGILLAQLQLSTEKFGLIASVYAVSAGISAFLVSGFADRFDRKRFLIVFYAGFLIGLLLCAIAPSFELLLGARIITGAFGGVMASISYAMVADLFPLYQRGRVMGWLQMAFAASLVAGLPISLFVASAFSWQLSYWLIFGLGLFALILVGIAIRPVGNHSSHKPENPWQHSWFILKKKRYWTVFTANMLIVGGDVIFMTFNAAFMVNNLGIPEGQLPWVYGAVGITSLIAAPIFGRLSDRLGKFPIFLAGTLIALFTMMGYINFSTTSLGTVIAIHVMLFLGINARMVSSTALATAIPKEQDRGAFMSIDSSIQQLAGGAAAGIAGLITFQAANGMLLQYTQIGWLIACLLVLSAIMVFVMDHQIKGDREQVN